MPISGGIRVVAVLAAFAAAGIPAPSAHAADDAALAFYQGKQMRFVTMGGPGGGYDTYTRTLASFLEKRLGAKIIPTNETGAGGLLAMSRTLNATPDGLTMLLIGGEALVTGQIYGVSGVNYDVRKQVWLARVSSEAKVGLLGPTSPYKTVADMVKSDKPVIWAGSGKTDGNADFAAIMGDALGVKTKIIVGYKGSGHMNLAIQRGEVDGRIVSDESAALFGGSTGMRVVTVLARKRAAQFPDVPTVFEAAPELAPAKAKLIDWRAGIAELGRVILVTPGTPPERVNLLRKALAEVMRDPAFIAETKRVKLAVNYAGGDEVRTSVEKAMGTLDERTLGEVRKIALERYYQ